MMVRRPLVNLRRGSVAVVVEPDGTVVLEATDCTEVEAEELPADMRRTTEERVEPVWSSLISPVALLLKSSSRAAQSTQFQPAQPRSRSGRLVQVEAEAESIQETVPAVAVVERVVLL
jgi:hypothetical protein